MANVSTYVAAAPTVTYSANMTFEEACAILDRGESLSGILMYVNDGGNPVNAPLIIARPYTDLIELVDIIGGNKYEWTSSGIRLLLR